MTFRAKPWCLLLALSIAMSATRATATLVLPQNIEQLESQAQLIFAGVCTGRTSAFTSQGIPVNIFTFEVRDIAKGNLRTGARIEVRHFGNDVPNAQRLAMRIPGIPTYTVGQEVVLFLNPPSAIGLTAPVGLSQGLFSVEGTRDGKRRIRLDPVRRSMLTKGLDHGKYAAGGRFTAIDRDRLANPPEVIEVSEFCSLVRKLKEEREK